MIPRVLILEDDYERCVWFRRRFATVVCDLTDDVSQAIEWLVERDYDLILLDHDLREEHYLSYDEADSETGFAVARWLAQNPESQRESMIIVHSLNYPGSLRMIAALTDASRVAEHIPFPYLQSRLIGI